MTTLTFILLLPLGLLGRIAVLLHVPGGLTNGSGHSPIGIRIVCPQLVHAIHLSSHALGPGAFLVAAGWNKVHKESAQQSMDI